MCSANSFKSNLNVADGSAVAVVINARRIPAAEAGLALRQAAISCFWLCCALSSARCRRRRQRVRIPGVLAKYLL